MKYFHTSFSHHREWFTCMKFTFYSIKVGKWKKVDMARCRLGHEHEYYCINHKPKCMDNWIIVATDTSSWFDIVVEHTNLRVLTVPSCTRQHALWWEENLLTCIGTTLTENNYDCTKQILYITYTHTNHVPGQETTAVHGLSDLEIPHSSFRALSVASQTMHVLLSSCQFVSMSASAFSTYLNKTLDFITITTTQLKIKPWNTSECVAPVFLFRQPI